MKFNIGGKQMSIKLFVTGGLLLFLLIGGTLADEEEILTANDEVPAHGPYALKDADLKKDGSISRKAINDEWFILRKRMSWGDAAEACENASAHLIVLPREKHAKKLVKELAKHIIEAIDRKEYTTKFHIVEFGPDRRYWIGLTDRIKEGEWMWIKYGLELLYDLWYPGQPDHNKPGDHRKAEHCVSLWNPNFHAQKQSYYMFNDEACSHKYYAICGTDHPTY